MLSSLRPIVHAIAITVVPETASLDAGAWTELDQVMDDALAQRDERVRQQLATFLRLLQFLPLARYGRRFTALNARQRTAFLESIERSPLLVLRRGFWGLRTLIFMGYYTRDDVAESIGYQAHPDGWTARGGTASSVPLDPVVWIEP
ncbi:MAG TPA: gluconate 2-dehydrogenase subunit 3 family protein [Gemmatimonadaceae bacterium]|nr:gluconate 2-dehydrogenase subunit 3 family protein [Gemmatimonadaceae bacterium]